MLFQKITDLYQQILESGDAQMNSMPLMASPLPCILLTLAYLYFVKVAGPKLMKNRAPFELRNLMIIYNLIMVIISTYLFVEMGRTIDWGRYYLKCQKLDLSNSVMAQRSRYLAYYFYLTKYLEFFDTIFFVLRKKNNQISVLHVYHHSVVPITTCVGIKYEPGGNNSIFPFINSGVHIVMYAYYFLSALGPKFQKYLFFKKYITKIQLGQFLIVFIHALKNLFSGCHSTFLFVNLFHAAVFFYLFTSFYKKSYVVKKNIYEGRFVDANFINGNSLIFKTIIDENGNQQTVPCYGGPLGDLNAENKSKDN